MASSALPTTDRFIPEALRAQLAAAAEPVPGVPGLALAPGLQADFPALLSPEPLALAVEVFQAVREELAGLLARRMADRAWIDETTRACAARNARAGIPWEDPATETIIGRVGPDGQVVVGPLDRAELAPIDVPPVLRGEQVTLFGPPDDPKLAVNAMNALHRAAPDEPALVGQLVDEGGQVPRWGADSEDSMTPMAPILWAASRNLQGCYRGDLDHTDPRSGKHYAVADDRLAVPIKRIAGLALPDGNTLLDGVPLPLHLVDLVLHLWHNHDAPAARVLYIPKLETAAEAAYLRRLIGLVEAGLQHRFPHFEPGLTRLFVVFENPRAIFRIREIAAALAPCFVGGSLGWHDFLASTARMFKEEPGYRIPVKADPNIVIHHIRESHQILVESLRDAGGICIGGMYGVLPVSGEPGSMDVTMAGYIRDVVTQLRRGLDGYWVAHPDFVRVGLALVQAWRRLQADPDDTALSALVDVLLDDPDERAGVHAFLAAPDVPGLEQDDPRYHRGVLAADLGTSDYIANDHPDEVRYNVFQALQYLAAWLTGSGCVALPAAMPSASGDKVFVRVMDDLATTERSRWELWAEVRHGRVSRETFEGILAGEVAFLQAGRDTDHRRIQVRWEGEAARWYPVAVEVLRALVTSEDPPEFVTELLLPFTFAPVREAEDPWATLQALRA